MTSNTVQGNMILPGLAGETVRIAAVDSSSVVRAETRCDNKGHWRMTVSQPPERVLAQLSGPGIAAGAVRADNLPDLKLPNLWSIAFEFQSAPEGVQLWIDPLALDHIPDQLLPALRTHADGTIDLHLGSYPADAGNLTVHLQSGLYRLAGGRLALHPTVDPGQYAAKITGVENIATGEQLPLQNGNFILGVEGAHALRVTFGRFDGDAP